MALRYTNVSKITDSSTVHIKCNKLLKKCLENNENPTEISLALNIARQARNDLLNESGTITSHLYRFYTVSQILGREDDIKWAESEINGYEMMQMPVYRKNIFAVVEKNGKQITKVINDHEISISDYGRSVSEIEYLLNEPGYDKYIPYEKTLKLISTKYKISPVGIECKIAKRYLQRILIGLKLELIRRLTVMISEIIYVGIPQQLFKEIQEKVNKKLTTSNALAVSALNKAFESLGTSEDPERIAQVSLACRRLIKYVADMVFPASSQGYKMNDTTTLDVSEDKTLNRLAAYVDSANPKNKESLLHEINLLRAIYSGDESLVNKGIHDKITNAEAKRMVLYTYIVLGNIILEKKKLEPDG